MREEMLGEAAYYNLAGGPRCLVLKGGVVKAIAPGLRLVEATDEEQLSFAAGGSQEIPKLYEYGLPV